MPELPEVETVRQTLRNRILGRKILLIDAPYSKIIHNDLSEFKNALEGRVITEIYRRGKYLIFSFGNDSIFMLSHLRMEGKYYLKEPSEEINKHEHVIFHLDGNLDLRYHDVRKFGVMELRTKDTVYNTEPISLLGLEPNEIDYKKVIDKFNNNHSLKSVLLDQSVLTGIGNIYADEICFYAKLNPSEICSNLSIDDIKNICEGCEVTLNNAIKAGGTTIRSYTSSLGVTGRFQLSLNVHTMQGKPCPNCKTTIIKTRVAGRGTYYCPNCQKLKNE